MKTTLRTSMTAAALTLLAGCQSPPTTMVFLLPGMGGYGGYAASNGGAPVVQTVGNNGSGSGTRTTTLDPESIAIQAHVAVSGGAAAYMLSALTAYTAADVDHVTLTLLRSADGGATYSQIGSGVTKTLSGAQLGNAVTINNLRLGTHYKVVAQAYADVAGAQQIDNIAQIGSDGDCSTTFVTPSKTVVDGVETVGDAPPVTIPLHLRDKAYNGQAAGSGLVTTNGSIVNDTSATESF